MVRQLTRWFLSSPGAQLVAGAIVLALAFPSTPIGTWGWMICAAALGVGVSAWWPHLPAAIRKPPVRIATALVLLVIAVVAIASFWDVLSERPDWQMGDWGPQRAVLARIMPSLPGLDVPVWNHVVSTGDAPLELYPALTYLVTGHFAWLFGLQNDLPLAFMIVATLVHLGLALTTTAVAIRVSSRPVALVIGLFWLFDTGAVSHGGTIGLYHWGLLHSAFAHVFSMIAALGILAALARPRIGASITIWIATAISVAAHPVALITSAAYVIALGAVALLAGDVPPRRALAAIGHVVLGVALGATVWLPASERLLAYGQHFPNELYDTVKFVQVVMSATVPTSAYAPIIFAGHLGALTGMWTRRAAVIFVSIVAIVLVFGIAEAPYLAFGLAPGKSVARLGAIRLLMLARPFVFAAGAYAIHALIAAARTRWAGARPRARAIAAAVLGVLAVCAARVVPEYYRAESFRAVDEARQFAPDHEGREALVQWAERQMQEVGPTRMARALFEEDTHEQYHLTAETGLPTLHMGAIPDLMLRDRMESTDPESLRRFDVRWAIAIGHAPTLGDPATQKVVGDFYIQDITGWDGQFARIERGTGTVTVARLDDRAVVIDVDAHEPVLVALGTGYYPRWRATHETGADEPVYALPGTANGTLHVVSAWVAPGRTTFTCDGRL
ncbi:MAG TPA: hypothetical protein VLX92_29365, partial [Kofleriaceae bacterium]|nr:hypothetical protein [Kofleriaceae bacterium]